MSNIQPYIILNGTDSRSITGLLISALAPISKPLQRTLVDTVDGRDGDLVTPLGFSAYDKPISIALTYGYDIDDIIEYFNSEGVVTFSNEPDKYYRYAIYEQIDFERLIRFKTAEVTLHCQPFKFSTTETPKLFNVTSGSPITVKNDGNYQSRPNLTIIGSGDVDLSLNGSQVLSLDLEDNQAIIIDTEDMNAYAAQTAIKEVIAEINPVQDLHGQEYPYPAGAGLNIWGGVGLLQSFIDANISGLSYDTAEKSLRYGAPQISGVTVKTFDNVKANTPYTFIITAKNTNNTTHTNIAVCYTDNTYIAIQAPATIQNKTTFAVVTNASKTIASIKGVNYSGQTTIYYDECCMLEGIKTISDFAPYENICPITGFTESNVKLYGVNAWDEVWELGTIDATTGQDAPASSLIRSKNYIPVLPQTSYFCYCGKIKGESSYSLPIYCYDKDKNYIGRPTPTSVNNATFTTPANCYYVRFRTGSEYGTTYLNDISFNPATVTTYEPYLGSEYTIEFEDDQGNPITAYKGRINFTTGVLTIKGGLYSTTWTQFNQNNGYKAYRSSSFIRAKSYENAKSNTIGTFGSFSPSSMNKNIIQLPVDTATYAYMALDENVDPTTVQIYYEFFTPQEIQLTPTIINNLLGLNQMYADNNGDISVTFSSNGVIQTETGDIVSFNVAVEDMQKGILLNRLVIGDYDKIRLSKGNNTIVLTGGAQQLVIDKYSRWI